MAGEHLFRLHNFQQGFVNGRLANFGPDYEIKVELLSACRASYPFGDGECVRGDVIIFPDDSGTNLSIVLGREIGSGQLDTFDMRAGTPRRRGSSDGEGLAYGTWQIHLQDSGNDCPLFSHTRGD